MKFPRKLMTAAFRPSITRLEDRTTPTAAFAVSSNTLFAFDTSSPSTTTSTAITGLGAGENIVGIDVRPQNGQLYGLSSNGAGAVRLYAISPVTGTAVGLGTGPVQFDDGSGNPVAIGGTNFGVDFNPTVDRFRVVTNTGVNFRINPNTGLIVDGNTTTPGVNADGVANGGTTTLDATAYTNNAPNVTATTQYTLDAVSGKLFIQNPPNAGTQTSVGSVTVAGVPLAFTAVNGFDIPAGVNVATSNTAATGKAFAVLTVGTSSPTLFSIDLSNGNATSIGAVGIGSSTGGVTGFAVQPNSSTIGIPFVGIAGGNVIRFNTTAPGTVSKVAISGLGATESVVGLDRRPSTGQYYALVQDTTASTVRLAVLDPQTGGTTALSGGNVSLTTAAAVAITFPTGTSFGIDFNPTVDKLRVVTSTGTNFRIDPATGSAVDGDTTATGVQPDASINGGTAKADATAYTNNFNKATVTTQYVLDASTDKLYIQNPPNAGTETVPVAITFNGSSLDFTDVSGFDIPSTVRVTASNTAATGTAFAALTVAGNTALYAINLTSGAAAKIGSIDAGTTPLTGLTLSEVSQPNTALLGTSDFVAGVDAGAGASAKLYGRDAAVKQTVASPFGNSFTGGVRVASADFNGDGVNDIVVGTGPGIATDVRIIDGRTNSQIAQFVPFEPAFTGGVFVSAGDLTGDGLPELVISPDQGGGPRVRIFQSGNPASVLADFFGIADTNFRGGARTAIGDVNGDGIGDLGVAAGFGGGPRVAIFNGSTLPGSNPTRLANDFFAFENTLRNGVFLTLGDLDGDGKADIIAGGGPGGGPRVTVFNGNQFVTSGGATISPIANFFAGDTSSRGGIRVAAKDLDGDSKVDIIVGSGAGAGARVTAYAGSTITASGTPAELFAFDAFSGTNGVFVG